MRFILSIILTLFSMSTLASEGHLEEEQPNQINGDNLIREVELSAIKMRVYQRLKIIPVKDFLDILNANALNKVADRIRLVKKELGKHFEAVEKIWDLLEDDNEGLTAPQWANLDGVLSTYIHKNTELNDEARNAISEMQSQILRFHRRLKRERSPRLPLTIRSRQLLESIRNVSASLAIAKTLSDVAYAQDRLGTLQSQLDRYYWSSLFGPRSVYGHYSQGMGGGGFLPPPPFIDFPPIKRHRRHDSN